LGAQEGPFIVTCVDQQLYYLQTSLQTASFAHPVHNTAENLVHGEGKFLMLGFQVSWLFIHSHEYLQALKHDLREVAKLRVVKKLRQGRDHMVQTELFKFQLHLRRHSFHQSTNLRVDSTQNQLEILQARINLLLLIERCSCYRVILHVKVTTLDWYRLCE